MRQFDLVKKYRVRPVRFLGQNFLVDENVIRNIIDKFGPRKGETIVEIGPGLGALTFPMLERGARVIGIEKDPKLRMVLVKELGVYGERFELVDEDILEFGFRKRLKQKKVRVIGNLPYYLTSPLIFHLIRERANIKSAILMVQKEVADRLMATPGTSEYGRLTVAVRFFADTKRLMNVSKNSFMPPPKIESSVVLFEFHPQMAIKKTGVDPDFFLETVKAAFSQRRKNLVNCLCHSKWAAVAKDEMSRQLQELGIDPAKRAEELFLKDFIRLCRKLQECVSELHLLKRRSPDRAHSLGEDTFG